MSDSENVESKKKGRAVVEKRGNPTASEKDEVPAKRGRGRPKGTLKKNNTESPKKNVIKKAKTKTAKGRGRATKKKEDSTEDDTEDNETENNESDE